jgi:translocation and assembly module TamB
MKHALRIVLFSLLMVQILAGQGRCALLPEFFWNWGGSQLLAWAQSQIKGKIEVKEISGNPLTGLTYKDITIAGQAGEPVMQAARLELRLSPWSIPSLHPDVAWLALYQPQVYLTQEPSGGWNVSHLLKEPAPAKPPTFFSRVLSLLFREIDFSDILVQKGELDLTRTGVTRRYTDLKLTSSLKIFNLGRPQLEVQVNPTLLAVNAPQGRLVLHTALSYSAGILDLASFSLKVADQPFLTLRGQVCNPLADLSCKLAGKLGPIQGAELQRFWERWPTPWNVAAGFTFQGAPGRIQLTAQGDIGQAKVDLQGQFLDQTKPAAFDLDLVLKGLATAQLEEIKGLNVEKLRGLSPLDAHLTVKGAGLPWKPEKVEARLEVQPLQYQEVKVSEALLTLQGDTRTQDLNGILTGNFGSLTLKSNGRLWPWGEPGQGPGGDLTLEVREFQPSRLGLAKWRETLLNGRLAGKFRLPPNLSLAQAYLAASLEASGRLENEPLKQFQSRFVLEQKKLNISEGRLRLAALEANFSGSLSESGVDVKFNASLGPGKLPLCPPQLILHTLLANGAVRGPWKSPQLTLAAKGNQLAYQGIKLASINLSANLTGLPPQSGNLQLEATELATPAGAFAHTTLGARGEAGRWRFQLNAAAPKYPRIELAGAADLRARPLAILIDRLSWHDQALSVKNTAPFQVALFPGYEISPATFQVDGGTVSVEGLARNNQLTGRLQARELQATLFQRLGLPVQGKITAQIALSGTPRAPQIDGSLSLAAGKFKDIPVQSLSATLGYRDDRLQSAGSLEEGIEHSRLSWTGFVPVHFTLSPLKFAWVDKEISFRAKSEKANLSILTALVPDVQAAKSPLDLTVEVKGTIHRPQVSGQIQWGAGFVQVRQAGTPYKLAPGEIRLQGDKVTIPGIILESDGTLRVTGDIFLSGPQGLRALVRGQLDNFRLLDRGGNDLWSNGIVTLSGPLAALTATGHLSIPKAQFRPTFFRSPHDPDIVIVAPQAKPQAGPAPALWRNMQVHVTIDSSGNAWVRDPIARVEVKASLKAIKERGQPLALGGSIEAIKGTVDVNARPFKVDHAVLILPGAPGKPILVDGSASYPIEDITLWLTVTGTVFNPKIRLESKPPLPPADVLSYLAFGAPAATLSQEQYSSLGAQSLGVLGGISAGKLDEILGKSIPFLGGVSVKSGAYTVGVEKKITQNVSVSYERTMNENIGQYERQVVIDYKINKHLSVQSQMAPRNSGADVFYNVDF